MLDVSIDMYTYGYKDSCTFVCLYCTHDLTTVLVVCIIPSHVSRVTCMYADTCERLLTTTASSANASPHNIRWRCWITWGSKGLDSQGDGVCSWVWWERLGLSSAFEHAFTEPAGSCLGQLWNFVRRRWRGCAWVEGRVGRNSLGRICACSHHLWWPLQIGVHETLVAVKNGYENGFPLL